MVGCVMRIWCLFYGFFFFKQKTAYEMRISDWSSDVCSSDLEDRHSTQRALLHRDSAVEGEGSVEDGRAGQAFRVVEQEAAGEGGAATEADQHEDRKSVV